jgi:hypothetical protein
MVTNMYGATAKQDLHPKKDLHVGGVGAEPAQVFAAAIDPLLSASENWVNSARELANTADDFVHDHPWQAIGAAAAFGVTLGYLLSRRF